MNTVLLRKVLGALLLVVPRTRTAQISIAILVILGGIVVSSLPPERRQQVNQAVETVTSYFVP
jgi:hypothetical protein